VKLEYYSKRSSLLTRIKRSLAHESVSVRIGKEKKVTTRFFEFEQLDCSDLEETHWSSLSCTRVTVLMTGEQFVVTYSFSFGKSDWTLYKVVDE
jgi:hypothetical protein